MIALLSIDVTFTPRLLDYLRAFRASEFAGRFRLLHRARGVVLLVVGWALGHSINSAWVLALIALGLGEIFNLSLARACIATLRYVFDAGLRAPLDLSFSTSHITVKRERQPSIGQWSSVRAAVETDHQFTLVGLLAYPVPIPRKSVPDQQIQELRGLFASNTRLIDERTPPSPLYGV